MKRLGKIALWLLGIMAFLVATAFVFLKVYEEDIKRIAIQEVNKSLAVPMKVKTYDVTIFETFPHISLHFKDVELAESSVIANKPFVKAEEVYLVFNILDVINKDYTISKIIATNGEINVYEKGDSANYLIVKSSEDDTAESGFSLDKVELKNMHFEYSNDKNESFLSMNVNKVEIRGDISSSGSLLEFKGDGFNDSLTLSNQAFLKNKAFTIESIFSFTTDDMVFKETKVSFQEFVLALNGSIDLLKQGSRYDLSYKTTKAPLNSLIGLLPNEYLKELDKFKAQGEFELEGIYKGTSSSKENPHIKATFKIVDGSIKEPNSGKEIEQISFSGSYTNGKGNNSEDSDLALKGISFILNTNRMVGDFRMNNFKSPFLNMSLKGQANLEDWNGFIQSTGMVFTGIANLDVQYKGNATELKKGYGASQRSKGSIILKNISLEQQNSNLNFSKVSGVLNFDGNNMEYKDFVGIVSGNSFKANGELVEIIPYLLGVKKQLKIKTRIDFETFNLNSFTDKVTQASDKEIIPYQIPSFFSLHSTITAKKFTYDKIEASKINTEFNVSNGRLVVKDFKSKMLGGDFSFFADLKNFEKEKLVGKMNFVGENMDVKKMFTQFGNFGQETLTQEHLEGIVTAKVQLGAVFNKDFSLDQDMFYAHVNLVINNGRLKNFEPLQAMSSYIKIEELRDIEFSRLENVFEIKDGKIILPSMKITNSALNLSIGGTHTFKNYMNYNIQVKLADVLSSKYGNILKSKNQSEDGSKIFMRMEGTPDNLKFSLDKMKVKVVVKETIKEEKKTVKDLINKELFGKEKKDSATKKKIIDEEFKGTEWDE